MARLPKFHPPKSVLFITTSLEEGLLLKANPLMRAILETCLAKAQRLHKVRICHLIFEDTHVHIVLVVEDPEDVANFMGRFKTESAHAINRLLGRRKRTVWCEGYDSPILGNPVDVIKQIAYLYTNPSKDNLVESIEDYPNFSTWDNFKGDETTINCIPFKRPDIPKLSSLSPSQDEISSILGSLKELYSERIKLELEPDAWMEVMGIPLTERARINERISSIVSKTDGRNRVRREENNKSVLGADNLIRSSFSLNYRSKRKGKKSVVICSQISLRIKIIQTIKALVNEGKEIYLKWKEGYHSLRYPIGIYPPSMPRMGNLVAGVVS